MVKTETKPKPYYGLMDAMTRRNVTQNELADLIHVSKATFSRKINRKGGQDFYYSEADAISKKLGISIADFY